MNLVNKGRHDFISSYNFARCADLVYSEILTIEQFKKVNPEEIEILSKNDTAVFYKKINFTIKENDIIFTNTKLVNDLFRHLDKYSNLKNIILITNQTDDSVSRSDYLKKPECIKKWFSINVDFESNNLVPIPLGLSNEYSIKNPNFDNFVTLENKNLQSKKNGIYINYRANTNFSARGNIINSFRKFKWVYTDEPNLSIDNYLNQLNDHQFVLCPWGNGLDTHRIWETLYTGSIPVVLKHKTFEPLKDLPVLLIDSYESITEKLLNNFIQNYDKENFINDKLYMDYWVNLIKSEKGFTSKLSIGIKESYIFKLRTKIRIRVYASIESYSKKVMFNIRKIKKVPKKILKIVKNEN
jgi:hypothetical protein